jgi:hypothetical protein
MGTSMVQTKAQPFFSFTQKFKKCPVQIDEPFAAVKIRKIHSEAQRREGRVGRGQRVGSQL